MFNQLATCNLSKDNFTTQHTLESIEVVVADEEASRSSGLCSLSTNESFWRQWVSTNGSAERLADFVDDVILDDVTGDDSVLEDVGLMLCLSTLKIDHLTRSCNAWTEQWSWKQKLKNVCNVCFLNELY